MGAINSKSTIGLPRSNGNSDKGELAPGLLAAVGQYQLDYQVLEHIRKYTMLAILSALDDTYPMSRERVELRKKIVNALFQQDKQLKEWLASEFTRTMQADPSRPSTSG